jgi:UDPglucose--hexose-1-phosphate uridylyltransferase
MSDRKPELRRDPITGRWVIIASARGKRPIPTTPREELETPEARERCPFCYGKEELTPLELYSYRPNDGKSNDTGWQVRVVPNKFPAFGIFPEVYIRRVGLSQIATGYGAHEVVIDSPVHESYLEQHPVEHISHIVDAWWERHVDLERDQQLRYVLIFKNHGKDAGASLRHPHEQIIATTIIPNRLKTKLENARNHYTNGEGCIWCRQVEHLYLYESTIWNPDGSIFIQSKRGDRIVAENNHFVAFIPFAARMPYEIHIQPKYHQYSFVATTPEQRFSLAQIIKVVLMKVYKLLGNPSYNFYFHSAPNLNILPRVGEYRTIKDDFHWDIEILVRTSIEAGFEQGSGIYINPIDPVDAARYLRETEI